MLIRVLDFVDKLAAFFHNGQVSREVCVKDIVHTGASKRCAEQINGCDIRLETEVLAPCSSDRRSDLEEDDLVRILDRVNDLERVIAFFQCADRAVRDTLTAKRAVRVFQAVRMGDINCRV